MLDFAAFEQHLVNAHARGKKELLDVFYERPVYYKMDPVTVIAHGDVVRWAGESSYMDYELELGLSSARPDRTCSPTPRWITYSG